MQSTHASKTTRPPSFEFRDIAMPLRIATIAVCSVFAFLAFVGTVRYDVSQPRVNTDTNTQQNTQPNTDTPNTNQSSTPVINQPQNSSNSSSNSSTKTCSTSQKATYTSQYNTQLAQENTRHTSQLNFLTSTNAPASAFTIENTTHSSNLASITTQYQGNLRSIGC